MDISRMVANMDRLCSGVIVLPSVSRISTLDTFFCMSSREIGSDGITVSFPSS